jgi:hypothetical protein
MNRFEIFPSEGGFRVAGGVYYGNPVMSCSPWRKTRKAAERVQKELIRRDAEISAVGKFYSGSPERAAFVEARIGALTKDARGRAQEAEA